MELAYGSFDVIEAMAKTGNPNSIPMRALELWPLGQPLLGLI
jgi:hypothetical protein